MSWVPQDVHEEMLGTWMDVGGALELKVRWELDGECGRHLCVVHS